MNFALIDSDAAAETIVADNTVDEIPATDTDVIRPEPPGASLETPPTTPYTEVIDFHGPPPSTDVNRVDDPPPPIEDRRPPPPPVESSDPFQADRYPPPPPSDPVFDPSVAAAAAEHDRVIAEHLRHRATLTASRDDGFIATDPVVDPPSARNPETDVIQDFSGAGSGPAFHGFGVFNAVREEVAAIRRGEGATTAADRALAEQRLADAPVVRVDPLPPSPFFPPAGTSQVTTVEENNNAAALMLERERQLRSSFFPTVPVIHVAPQATTAEEISPPATPEPVHASSDRDMHASGSSSSTIDAPPADVRIARSQAADLRLTATPTTPAKGVTATAPESDNKALKLAAIGLLGALALHVAFGD